MTEHGDWRPDGNDDAGETASGEDAGRPGGDRRHVDRRRRRRRPGSVVTNGKGDLRSVRIDPSLLKPEEVEILEDLIVAAMSDARGKAEAAVAEKMQAMTGGLNLPPGMKLPF